MLSSASKTNISVSIGSVPFNFRTGTAALNNSTAAPTVSRSQSLPNLPSMAPTIRTSVSAAQTSKPLPWYQCEIEYEEDWLDDEERKLFENAQWGEPIVFKGFIGVSQLQALLQAK